MKKIHKIKIAKNASIEEMQQAIREITGNPEYVLDESLFKQFAALNDAEEEKLETAKNFLGEYYDLYKEDYSREGTKRKKELSELVAFTQFSPQEIKLISVREAPDFILTVDGKETGLELTGLYDEDKVADISALERLCRQAEKAIKGRNPESTKLINIEFNDELFFENDQRIALTILTDFLASVLDENPAEQPAFIKNIIIKDNQALQIVLAEVYEIKNIDTEYFDNLIRKKEAKIGDYIKNTGLENQWLLVIMEGESAKSNFELTPEMLPKRTFLFQRIILYNPLKQVAIAYPAQ